MRYMEVNLTSDFPHKFLDVWLDSKLTWKVHCNEILKTSPNDILNLSTFLFFNQFLYNSMVWGTPPTEIMSLLSKEGYYVS